MPWRCQSTDSVSIKPIRGPFYVIESPNELQLCYSSNDAMYQARRIKNRRIRKFKTLSEAEDYLKIFDVTDTPTGTDRTHSANKDFANALVAFADGACANNGRPGASAGLAVVWPDSPNLDYSGRLPGTSQTNNRAEYTAAIKCFEIANSIDPQHLKPLVIYTDSALLIKTMTLWLNGWIKRGWKRMDKKPIANLDLVQQIHKLSSHRKVLYSFVKAHTGGSDWASTWNDMADRLAQAACTSAGPTHSHPMTPVVSHAAPVVASSTVQVTCWDLLYRLERPSKRVSTIFSPFTSSNFMSCSVFEQLVISLALKKTWYSRYVYATCEDCSFAVQGNVSLIVSSRRGQSETVKFEVVQMPGDLVILGSDAMKQLGYSGDGFTRGSDNISHSIIMLPEALLSLTIRR